MTRVAGACPNCGATITFRWSSSVQTVCEHCRSILVRHDLDLARVGEVSDPPPETSPIQIGTTGRFHGRAFTVIGRLAYEYDGGAWSEWHLLFADGRTGWLSDAQLRYAVYERADPPGALPRPTDLEPGRQLSWRGTSYEVGTVTRAHYRGTEGELPFESWDRDDATFVDLVSAGPRVATIDYADEVPALYLGEAMSFDALELRNLRETEAVRKPSTSGLNCRSCGAPMTVRAQGQSKVVVCPNCLSLADATDPDVRILQTVAQRIRREPRIPLGSSGTWRDASHEVIGFQYRTIEVDGETYGWDEYVLFTPQSGFRYLSEYNGHWNDIVPVEGAPSGDGAGRAASRWLDGRRFRHFQSARATTAFVLGEFPWQVRVGDVVQVDDYVAPPFLLSKESAEGDVNWSLGEYVPGQQLWDAFGVEGNAPSPEGVFANQPSPYEGKPAQYWRTLALLALLLAVVALLRLLTGSTRVFEGRYRAVPGSAEANALVSEFFDLPGRTSSVGIDIDTNLSNDWLYYNLALINQDSGRALDFGREVSYYAGRDSDGAWTEGSKHDTVVVPSVPGGRYYLRIEPEGEAGRRSLVNYTLTVRRDVPSLALFIIAAGVLALPPIFVTWRSLVFERARWNESDYGEGDE